MPVVRPAGEGCERPHVANVVAARLLGEAAYPHVLDHARPQRTDGLVGRMGGHRGLLSQAEGCWTFDARDRTPQSSRLTAHYPAENAPTMRRAPSRESGFVLARVDSGRSPGRARKTRIPPKAVIETGDDQPLLTIATAYLKAIANSQFVLFSFLGGMFT